MTGSVKPSADPEVAINLIDGANFQRVMFTLGNNGVNEGDVSSANPMPVALAASVAVTGPLTDAELRASSVPVSGPLTDTQLRATELPVSLASVPLPTGAATDATISARIAAPVVGIPDNLSAANPVRLLGQDVWTCSFSDTGASILSSDFATPIVGTGAGHSQSGGSLLITTGTSTNAEFLTRSTISWKGSLRARFSVVASQRIANQNLMLLLADLIGEGLACTINSAVSITVTKVAHGFTALNVGQFIFVGGIAGAAGVPGRYAIASVPSVDTITFTVAGWPASGSCTLTLFGWSHVKTLLTGTTATNAAFTSQRRGWADADTTATINTTAAPGTMLQVDLDSRSAFLCDTLRASATGSNVSSRASRIENIPDDNLSLYFFVWNYNGSVAPATTTTWTISFASVEKFANIPVYIQGQKAVGTVNPSPVQVTNTVPVSVTGYPTAAASADGLANPTITQIAAAGLLFNGTTWDRARANNAALTGDTGAKTATFNGATQTNYNASGAVIVLNMGVVSGTTPTLTAQLQGSADGGTTFFNIPGAVTASITATGVYVLAVYPGVTVAANAAVSFPLPRTWRLVYTIGGTTPSFTITNVQVGYIN